MPGPFKTPAPQQPLRPNEPDAGENLPASWPALPTPPEGPSNWPVGDHTPVPDGGWIDLQKNKGR
jgi:hypothetical protein